MTLADTTLSSTPHRSESRSLSSDSLAMGIIFALSLTVFQRLLGGVRGIVFCRLMTDQELGQWSMLYSFLMILAPLSVLGLPGAFGKFVEHYYQQGQLRSFLRKIGFFCTVSTSLVALSIVLFPDFYCYQVFGDVGHRSLIYLMAGTLMVLTLLNYLTTLVEAMRQIRLVTIMRFVSGVSFTFFGILFLWVSPAGSYSATWAFLLSSIVGSVPALWYLSKCGDTIVDHGGTLLHRDLWVRLAPYATWWWLSNVVYNLYELMDRYMLIHFSKSGFEAAQSIVGQYHSGRVIPLLMVGVASMLSGILLPFVAKSWSEGNLVKARAQLNWTIKLSTLGMMGANVLLLAAGPFVFQVILDGKYDAGMSIFPLTMVYCTWFSISTVSQDFLWASEKGKYAVIALAFGLVVNIILNALLIPGYGLWGAVVATALGNLCALVALFGANFIQNCQPDAGCWAAVMMPLILLLPIQSALLGFMVFVVLALFTPLMFSKLEKEEILKMAQGILFLRAKK